MVPLSCFALCSLAYLVPSKCAPAVTCQTHPSPKILQLQITVYTSRRKLSIPMTREHEGNLVPWLSEPEKNSSETQNAVRAPEYVPAFPGPREEEQRKHRTPRPWSCNRHHRPQWLCM